MEEVTLFAQFQCVVKVPAHCARFEFDEEGQVETRWLVVHNGEEKEEYEVPSFILKDDFRYQVLEVMSPASVELLNAMLRDWGGVHIDFNLCDFVGAAVIGHFLFPVHFERFLEEQLRPVADMTRCTSVEKVEDMGPRESRTTRSNKSLCEQSDEDDGDEDDGDEDDGDEDDGDEDDGDEDDGDEDDGDEDDGDEEDYEDDGDEEEDSDEEEDEEEDYEEEDKLVPVFDKDNFGELLKKVVVDSSSKKELWRKVADQFINILDSDEKYDSYLKRLWNYRNSGIGGGGKKDVDCLYLDTYIVDICEKDGCVKSHQKLVASKKKCVLSIGDSAQRLLNGKKRIQFHMVLSEDGYRLHQNKGNERPSVWHVTYKQFVMAFQQCLFSELNKSKEWVQAHLIFRSSEFKFITVGRMAGYEKKWGECKNLSRDEVDQGYVEKNLSVEASQDLRIIDISGAKNTGFLHLSRIQAPTGEFFTYSQFSPQKLAEHVGPFDVFKVGDKYLFSHSKETVFCGKNITCWKCPNFRVLPVVVAESDKATPVIAAKSHEARIQEILEANPLFIFRNRVFNVGEMVKSVSDFLGCRVFISADFADKYRKIRHETFYSTATGYERSLTRSWIFFEIKEERGLRSLTLESWEDVKRLADCKDSDVEAMEIRLDNVSAEIRENLAFSFLYLKAKADDKRFMGFRASFTKVLDLRVFGYGFFYNKGRFIEQVCTGRSSKHLHKAPVFGKPFLFDCRRGTKKTKVSIESFAQMEEFIQELGYVVQGDDGSQCTKGRVPAVFNQIREFVLTKFDEISN